MVNSIDVEFIVLAFVLLGVLGVGYEQVMMELSYLKNKVKVVEDICLQNFQGEFYGIEGILLSGEDYIMGNSLSFLKFLNDTMYRKF